ncbi:efflux RND transporter periplasmic adaptor subunit [Sphingobacterium chuzhouense]|uniref:Efflux RND transporter periplasmic adaptor subunit n=1 Tax=Sphingobacterium chuzhouense TaxID=1742264 RepID=A0ABR7XT00_9SPHI|nr:efflux RND transporter periplasmic adaptor subunit [Sphingobacterium chuzhouense]MBD1422304.1 efflux RND transporter periplasmic adaptor subunit [Sphingobacterium chuzhouense]
MNFKSIIIFATALILVACNNDKKEEAKKEGGMPAMGMGMMNPMETVEISKSNPLVMLKLAGELKPDQRTELFAKVNSYVKSIRVDIGDRVSAGQVLVVLEAPEIQSQVANAKAKLEAQEAIYLSTKATYDRTMKANETQGAIAKDALDQIKARMLADEAQLNAAKSAYSEIRDVNNYLVIKAPFSGTVTSRNVDLGAFVTPMSKEPLLVVENNSKLRLNLSVAEANTPYIKLGDTVRFHVRSRPQDSYVALVSRKSGSLDLKLRSEKMEADFINKGNVLKPYMIAETTIPLQNSEPTFFVPKSAVVESGTGVYVIRVEDGKTKNVPVSKGRAMPDKLEVFGELNDGDKILKMGSEEIQEGTEVPNKPNSADNEKE